MWRSIKRALTRDIRTKLTAVGLAAFVFLVVLFLRLDTERFWIPIEVVSAPEYLELEDSTPKGVNVEIRGSKDRLNEIRDAKNKRIEISIPPSLIDLRGLNAAEAEPRTSTTVRLDFDRPNVKLVLSRSAQKFVDVNIEASERTVTCTFLLHKAEVQVAVPLLETSALLPPNYVGPHHYVDPSRIRVEPATLIVCGPKEALKKLERSPLPLVDKWLELNYGDEDVEGSEQTDQASLEVDFDGARVFPLDRSRKTVQAFYTVERTDRKREVEIQNIKYERESIMGQKMSYTPSKATITLQGRARVLEKVLPETITAAFNPAPALKEAPNPTLVDYSIILPEDLPIEVVGKKPEKIQVTITGLETSTENKPKTEPVPEEVRSE